MGFGLAGIGAAVGAASEGYMRGEKHRSEMEDAEARRGLVKLQTEEASLKLDEAKRDARYKAEREAAMADDEPSPAPATAANPTAAAAPAGGAIAAPGEGAPAAAPAAGIAAPGAKKTGGLEYDNLGKMQRLIQRTQAVDLKYGKIDPVQAVQMMKHFKTLQDEGVIDGMEYFRRTGDSEGAIAKINSTGAQKLEPGAKFSIEKREIAPGVTVDNVVITSADGKHSFNQFDTMVGALSPKDALSYRTETGLKLADLALKKTSEDNLKAYRDGIVNLKNLEYNELVRHHQAVEKVNLARMQQIAEERGDAAAARALKNREEASKMAFQTILQSYGVSKEMTEEKLMMLPKEKQAEYRSNILNAGTAHALWSMNLDPKNKEGVTPAEATQLARQIPSMPIEALKRDANGYAYIDYRGRSVYLPLPPEIKREAPATPTQPGVRTPGGGAPVDGSPTQPAATQARPGVSAIPTMQETQAQFRAAGAYVGKQKEAAAADPDLRELKLRQDQAMRNGRAAEVNNLMAQRNQIMRERYNLTPLGGIADPSKLGQQ